MAEIIFALLAIVFFSTGYAESNESRIIFDQRQTGKYNIHVSIKDVAIIELDRNDFRESNSDPDYYYDESDFTIKPLLAWYQSLNSTMSNLNSTLAAPMNLTSLIHTLPTTPVMQPTTTLPTSKKSSSVVILGKAGSFPSTKTQGYSSSGSHYESGKEIPVQVIMEPVLNPKFRTAQHLPYKGRIGNGNSRVFNLKTGRASYNDSAKREFRSSILGKLFSMLSSFHDGDGNE